MQISLQQQILEIKKLSNKFKFSPQQQVMNNQLMSK